MIVVYPELVAVNVPPLIVTVDELKSLIDAVGEETELILTGNIRCEELWPYVDEVTELLCYGKGAKEQVLEAFDLPADTEDILLEGVVSRKKQLIPTFVISLQQ